MQTATLSRVLGPAYYRWVHQRREPRRDRARRLLASSQFWSAAELRGLQTQKLRLLLRRAAQSSAWYAERLAHSPPASRFQLADLRHVPILEKADLQTHLADITGDGRLLPGTHEEFSGGSTGAPVRLYHTAYHAAHVQADLERNFTMCNGYRVGEALAVVWGAPEERGRIAPLKDLVANRLRLGGLALDGPDIGEYIERLRAFRPRLLVGYVSILSELAHALAEPLPSLRAIQASAETLTDEHRTVIEEAFEASVYNRYGAREVGNLAHECDAHNGLHLLMENNIVEIVDEHGAPLEDPEAEGEVVVTNLNNFATPLIRYRLGDVARVGERTCRCGRGAPLLASILGRTSGVISTPNGRRLHGEFFTHLFYGQPVRRFRVEQVTDAHLVVHVVPDAGYGPHVQDLVTRMIKDTGDERFLVDWREVAELARAPSGKFQFTIGRQLMGEHRQRIQPWPSVTGDARRAWSPRHPGQQPPPIAISEH